MQEEISFHTKGDLWDPLAHRWRSRILGRRAHTCCLATIPTCRKKQISKSCLYLYLQFPASFSLKKVLLSALSPSLHESWPIKAASDHPLCLTFLPASCGSPQYLPPHLSGPLSGRGLCFLSPLLFFLPPQGTAPFFTLSLSAFLPHQPLGFTQHSRLPTPVYYSIPRLLPELSSWHLQGLTDVSDTDKALPKGWPSKQMQCFSPLCLRPTPHYPGGLPASALDLAGLTLSSADGPPCPTESQMEA